MGFFGPEAAAVPADVADAEPGPCLLPGKLFQPPRKLWELIKTGLTCVVVSELADLPEPEPVGAEPVNEVVVVGEDAEPLVHHLAQVVDSLDVGVFPGERGRELQHCMSWDRQ